LASPSSPGLTAPTVLVEPLAPTFAQRFGSFRQRYQVALDVLFFFAGFGFDVALLRRIDNTPLLVHQGIYLALAAGLILWDHELHVQGGEPGGLLGKLASVRLWALHFFLGTLLNAFLIFYFRASSGVSAFAFLVALAVVVVVNEAPRFRDRGPIVRVLLLSFSVTTYLAYLLPVVWGELRTWQYAVAVVMGAGATFALWRLSARLTHDPQWTFGRAVTPGLFLQGALLGLYLVGVIPPVPLSLRHIGIYSSVTPHKVDGRPHYTLEFQPAPAWQLWRLEDEVFVSPAGARAWAFVRIFAPARFRDEVAFAWEYDDADRGWTSRGSPFTTVLSGGNEEGYRTFAFATMGRPGRYRVRVLTTDGREIGRKSFTYVEGVPSTRRTQED
jgi:hypothetical protein